MQHLGEFIVNHWILSALFVVLAGLAGAEPFYRKLSGLRPVGTAEAVQIINQQKGLFVDIREQTEYEKGHIANSVNIPSAELEENLAKLKNQEQPVVVVCASDQHGRSATKLLRSKGYSDVFLLKGGLTAWKEAKLPVFNKS